MEETDTTAPKPLVEVDHASLVYRLRQRGGESVKRAIISMLRGQGEGEARDFEAVRDVSLRLWPGRVIGLCGHNGSGKSTLLRLIAGTLQLTRGDITVRGRVGAILSLSGGFHGDFTGRENIHLNGLLLGYTPDEIDQKTREIITFAGLEEFIDSPVRTYSSGMCARLGFAIAAHLESDLLLIDELFSVGDISFQAKCQHWMEEQRELGKAMLIVSHDMEFLIQSADAMIWLDQGRVRGVGDPFRVGHTYLRWMHKKDEVGREKADTHVEQLERDVQQYMAENKIDEKSIPEQLLPATLLTKGNLTGVDAE